MSRIFLVDDHTLVRDGLRSLLRAGGHEVAGEAEDTASAIQGIVRSRPDVVLLDVRLGDQSGFDVLQAVSALPVPPAVLVLTMSLDRRDMEQALRQGARGYLLKTASRDAMLRAIATVAGGERYFGPELAALCDASSPSEPDRAALSSLSARERQVLELVVRGRSSAAIAAATGLSAKTVDTYRSRIMVKLQAPDVTALVRFAIRSDILGLDGH